MLFTLFHRSLEIVGQSGQMLSKFVAHRQHRLHRIRERLQLKSRQFVEYDIWLFHPGGKRSARHRHSPYWIVGCAHHRNHTGGGNTGGTTPPGIGPGGPGTGMGTGTGSGGGGGEAEAGAAGQTA